jgi:Flp pilus assembly protein TadG
MQVLSRMHDIRTRFTSESSGNIVIIFALALTLLGGAVGVAVDYARASRTDEQLQAALDSAVLAAARRQSIDDPDAEKAITDFLYANFKNANPGLNVAITASVQANGRVRATAKTSVNTTFMRLFGKQKVDVDASSSAQFGASFADIALVLDNTTSMEGARMAALKDSAKRLVDILYAVPRADNKIRVGLVPFAQYVNVGMGNRHEPWIDVEDDNIETVPPGPCANQCVRWTPAENCHPVTYTCYRDGIPSSCNDTRCDPQTCLEEQYICPSSYTRERKWYGCVGSRPYPLDVQTSSDFATRVPGVLEVGYVRWARCPEPITRLSNVKDDIKDAIDAMNAMPKLAWDDWSGNTYIPSGLIWGWRALSSGLPFQDGTNMAAKPDAKRYLVLMTDGVNTVAPNPPGPVHDNVIEDRAHVSANNLTAEACQNIKNEGIIIFAVAFEVTDATTRNMLEACASAPPYYFAADDADSLRSSFETIANSVIAIRLSK